jgi:pentose-5-phosphate-3-epimerase
LSHIRALGCRAGLVLAPATPLEHCRHLLDQMDVLVVMGVAPGFGGQSFIPSTLQVIRIFACCPERLVTALLRNWCALRPSALFHTGIPSTPFP